MELLSELGLWGLGFSAFLAATILPLSSELVLSALSLAGENPLTVIVIASLGNVAGSVVNYLIGRWGADTLLHRWFHLSQQQTDKAEQQFNRYGKWSLLISHPISLK
ncbi:MAG: DedA family protein [Methylophaga sp.]|nr:DedA family protein [Methylophaga sp.]